jgi:hypothetical protein
MPKARWWIVYGDRSIYSSNDGTAWNAPARGVQVVISTSNENGLEVWRPWRETNYYVYFHGEDRWLGVDMFGMWDYLCEPGPKRVLFARTMFDEDWHALLQWVNEHPDLPIKTGWRPGEQ